MKIDGNVSVSSSIRKFKDGFWVLSRIKWFSISGLHVSVAGLLGVAGFVWAVRGNNELGNVLPFKENKVKNILSVTENKMGNRGSLPSSSKDGDFQTELYFVPGLRNLGTNCFLNVVLQALASCFCFRQFLHSIIEEAESSLNGEKFEGLQLTAALTTLLEGLCVTHEGRKVLSPVKVMRAMSFYIHNFHLSRQQDAAEAFLHLLSCLRREFSECYAPNYSSLAYISAFPNCRILTPSNRRDTSEQEKWQRHFLGPFDGILGSLLTCQSCSFQIMLDFEFFHSLSLSPVHDAHGTIIAGCTVEDCLRRFIVAEQVENYHCRNCWHIAATKYLSLEPGNEEEIQMLRNCTAQDSCSCRRLGSLEALPWSNHFSRTLKQLSIVRHPKILCIHIQRASMNIFGQTTKIQGHISFPLILNLLPFMKNEVGIKHWEDNVLKKRTRQQNRQPGPDPRHFNMRMYTEGFSDTKLEPAHDEVSAGCDCDSSDQHSYHLVAVVEHLGSDAASGHYTIYRRARAAQENESQDGRFAPSFESWFCISDSHVQKASEEDVLSAEASLLFYERTINE